MASTIDETVPFRNFACKLYESCLNYAARCNQLSLGCEECCLRDDKTGYDLTSQDVVGILYLLFSIFDREYLRRIRKDEYIARKFHSDEKVYSIILRKGTSYFLLNGHERAEIPKKFCAW